MHHLSQDLRPNELIFNIHGYIVTTQNGCNICCAITGLLAPVKFKEILVVVLASFWGVDLKTGKALGGRDCIIFIIRHCQLAPSTVLSVNWLGEALVDLH